MASMPLTRRRRESALRRREGGFLLSHKDPEKARAYRAAYNTAHRKERLVYDAAYRAAHREAADVAQQAQMAVEQMRGLRFQGMVAGLLRLLMRAAGMVVEDQGRPPLGDRRPTGWPARP